VERRRLPPLNALRAFEAAARHLNFSRAADELSVTPGAVSQQIQNLEDYIAIEAHIRRARVERSFVIAQMLAGFIDDAVRGLKKLAAKLGMRRAGALPKWARHAPAKLQRVPAEV